MITRSQMRRQLRAQGGIMNVAPRKNFLFGGLGDRIRKLVPNEIANVAVKAAPFVAPFNPGVAGLMRGIGRYDQRGSISDALKQGLATTAFGAGARYLGGAENVMGGGLTDFSSPIGQERGLGKFLQGRDTGSDYGQFDRRMTNKTIENQAKKKASGNRFMDDIIGQTMDKIPGVDKLPQIVQEKLLVGGITGGATYLYEKFLKEEPPQDEGETYEQYMARRKENVGRKMRTYMDNYFANDPEYMQLDDAGRDAFVARYNVRDGGRIGYQTGGITMANTLQQNIAANRAQAAGIQNLLNQARASAGLPTVQAPAQTTTVAPTQTTTAAPTQTTTAAPSITTSPAPTQTTIAAPSATTSSAQGIASIPRTKLSFPYESDEQRFRSEGFDYSQPNTYQPGQAAPAGFKVVDMDGDTYLEKLYPSKSEIQSMLSGSIAGPANMMADPVMLFSGLNPIQFGNLSEAQSNKLFKEYEALSKSEKDRLEKQLTAAQDKEAQQFLADEKKFGSFSDGRTLDVGAGRIAYNDLLAVFKNDYPNEFTKLTGNETLAELDQKLLDLRPAMNFSSSGGGSTSGTKPNLEPVYTPRAMMQRLFNKTGGRVGFEEGGTNFMKWLKANYGLEVKDLDINLYSRLSREFNNENPDPEETGRKKNAGGGIMSMPMGEPRVNKGGITELDYRAKGGFVPVGIKERADDVPAMLSKNEFVFTADAVRGAGNGSIEKGAQKMYDTMKNLERRVT